MNPFYCPEQSIAANSPAAERHSDFDHDADVGIIGRGAVLEEAFEAAAAATFAQMRVDLQRAD